MSNSKEYYGSVKGMPQELLVDRLAAARKALRELEVEAERRGAFTQAELMADRLHKLLHFGVDCDYYYSDWPNPAGCRARFLNAATTAFKVTSLGEILNVLENAKSS